MNCSEFEKLSDERLIELIHDGEDLAADILIDRYKNEVRKKSYGLRLIGADEDDLIQEGMIGLFRAVRDYRNDRECTFQTFAVRCIKAAMINAMLHYQSKKYGPLNTSLSLSESIDESNDSRLEDVTLDKWASDPERITLDSESIKELIERIRRVLSAREQMVFEKCLMGLSTEEIAVLLDCEKKSVENALHRIKKKIKDIS